MHPWLRAFVSILGLAIFDNPVIGQPMRASSDEMRRPTVLEIRLDNQAITPISTRFIERAIEKAEQDGAECLIIILDTPGGLVDSTRATVKHILASEVPVVVYVAPSGARAASAGVFITLASHVAAMAPGTNIGAAHPVQIGGLPTAPPERPDSAEEEDSSKEEKEADNKPSRVPAPAEEKLVNDTVAWARSLAELRGRNADWAARAVRESVSAPASEAVEEKAVDLLAEDVKDLLRKIDGREVALPRGKVRLKTADAQIRTLEMWWGERILTFVTNPNVAFLLLIFGFYGILFELYAPGWGVAGTLGLVCLLLAMLSLAILPINAVGVALIAVALGLFVAEVFVISYGALTVGGIACLTLGAMMLVDSPVGFLRISLWTVLPVALATGLVTVFLVGSVVKAHRGPRLAGDETLVGTEAVARESFSPDGPRFRGMVRVAGELWTAVSPTPVAAGERLTIQGRRGLMLEVQPSEDGAPVAPSATTEHIISKP
jgi:membrane-bound serine protease (ClpP class)